MFDNRELEEKLFIEDVNKYKAEYEELRAKVNVLERELRDKNAEAYSMKLQTIVSVIKTLEAHLITILSFVVPRLEHSLFLLNTNDIEDKPTKTFLLETIPSVTDHVVKMLNEVSEYYGVGYNVSMYITKSYSHFPPVSALMETGPAVDARLNLANKIAGITSGNPLSELQKTAVTLAELIQVGQTALVSTDMKISAAALQENLSSIDLSHNSTH